MLELPNLDDKPYQQILNEAVARIPALTSKWTDYNPSDPGIMLLELLAAYTEMQNYYVDTVGERFYQKYLDLVTPSTAGEDVKERIISFAQECCKKQVAVTLADYEQLVKALPFSIGFVKARYAGSYINLTIFRKSGPLDGKEIKQLREAIEPYRLLTVRIRIQQVISIPVRAFCRILFDSKKERPEYSKKALEILIKDEIEGKKIGERLNTAQLLSAILTVPGVINVLSFTIEKEGNENAIEYEDVFFSCLTCDVEFADSMGESV